MSDYYSIIISNYSKNCEIKFYQNDSKTFEENSNLNDFNLKFSDLSLFAKDFIYINNFKFNFEFFLAFDTINNVSAILGFKLNDEYKKMNFIFQLKKNNFIENFDFFFDFDENFNKNFIFNNNFNNFKGKIFIGKFPHEINKKLNEKNLFFVNSNLNKNNKNNFNINFDYVLIKNKFFNVNFEILFEQFFISFKIEFLEIFKEIFKEFFNKKICFEIENKNYNKKEIFFVCDEKIKISNEIIFNIKNKNFSLNFDDLFLKINEKFYFLIVFENNFILGNIFLQKNLLIFNQEKKQIGFYIKNNKNNKNIFILFQTLIIFLCVFIIIFLLFLIKKILSKQRKIKANELEENFDYFQLKK
jgi:hypothetical protein